MSGPYPAGMDDNEPLYEPLTDDEAAAIVSKLYFYAALGLASILDSPTLAMPHVIDPDNVRDLIEWWTALAEDRAPTGKILSPRLAYLCLMLLEHQITAAMTKEAAGLAAVMDPKAGGKA